MTNSGVQPTTPSSDAQPSRGLRSPGYPGCDLPTALDRARKLKDYSPGRKPVPIDAALKAIGPYAPRSGAGMQMIANLKKYGLVEDSGSLDTRSVRLSDLAHQVLTDVRPISPERDALIRKAALMPKINAEIRERWAHGLPDESTVHTWLAGEKSFNEKVIPTFLRDLRTTFEYAKLDSEPAGDQDTPPGGDKPAVGDFVQWTSQGVAQFPEPRRLDGFSDDGAWAFVDGSPTGVAVDELTIERKGSAGKAKHVVAPQQETPTRGTPPLAPVRAGVKEDVFSLGRGPVVVRWPDGLDDQDVADLVEYWPILLRKIKRSGPEPKSDTKKPE